ncbi:peptidoglycan-binding domain-containing protein, partial [Ilumatobacter sp.]|uniref:peptidoglycan-binding domain-containing protein n=1 Tax=Ilumatobacter sp. TaxID=1967498 RepID=UPI003C561B5F
PATAPPADAPEPEDERCSSYSVDEDLPVGICDRGALIVEVQRALTATGFDVPDDGFFTSVTEDAVIQFQAREGLEQDGLVGPQTAAMLGIS